MIRPRGSPGSPPRRRWLAPALLVALLFALAFPRLSDYNVTWDEALADLFFGERYLSFFTTLDRAYLDFDSNPYPGDHLPNLFVSPHRTRPWEHYPFASTLAAASSVVFSRWLGWLDPFDGFHAANLVLAGVLIWVWYRFLDERLGPLAALVAIALLFTAPRIVCDLMANLKDFPVMVLFTLTAALFFRAIEAGSVRGLLGSGAVLGLALATKANALLFPVIAAAFVVAGGVPAAWKGRERSLKLALAGAGALSLAVCVAVWPYVWADPVHRLGRHALYVLGWAWQRIGAESHAPPLQMLLLTTPPVLLALFALGLVPCMRRALRSDRLALFLLLWIGVLLARWLVPGAVNYDGVRHLLELFPPVAAVAGIGAATIAEAIGPRRAMRIVLAAALLLPGAVTLVRTHPFQIAYWNFLAGGLKGAYARGLPQACDYWGASYRLGLRWLDANAPQGAALAVPVVEHAVRLVAPLRLRPDIELLHLVEAPAETGGIRSLDELGALALERPVYVMFVLRMDWATELMRDCMRRLVPAAEWRLDGAPVLRIYRYAPPAAGPASSASS